LIYKKQILFLLFSLIIIDSFRWISYSGSLGLEYSTYISLFLIYSSIYFLIKISINSKWKIDTPIIIQNLLKLWIGLNIINFIRGLFLAENYWDYKFLFLAAIPFFLVSLVFFIGNNLQKVYVVFKFVFKFLFPFGFFLIPLTLITNAELYSRIMIPISLFILFIPFVQFKYKILIILVAVTSVLLSLDFRTNLIKVSFSIFLLPLLYYKLNFRSLQILNLIIFTIPITLFILAFSGTFNVLTDFSDSENFDINTNEISEQTLNNDTRTFLYYEVLESINKSEGFLFSGSGMISTYKSIKIDVDGSLNNNRYSCEVGILNILLKSGIIGVIIYFLILFMVSFIAISHSSNMLSKILGLYISFRWILSFIEEFSQYDLNFYFFWLAIGLVSSKKFRGLSDQQIKNIFR
jgi:hypothetical protein